MNNNDPSLEKTMEEHMQENKKKTKITIDFNTLFIYVVMIAVIVSLSFLLLKFCEKCEREANKTTTTTTMPTTTTTSIEVIYQTTTRAETQTANTVFDGNRNR